MAERRPAGYPKLKNYKPSRFMLPTSHYDKAKVNPSLGYTVDIECLRDAYREAKQNPADEVTFKWLRLPFLVKVRISDLNIRKGPGIDYDRVQFIPVGVYTIMEVRSGKGSSAGWGRLKSGIGWISLDFALRI